MLDILIAGVSNTLFQASPATFVGRAKLVVRVFPPLLIAAAAGLAFAWNGEMLW